MKAWEVQSGKPSDSLDKAAGFERILALDYGRKRIGLAISDERGAVARPLGVMHRKNRQRDLARLRQICTEHAVARLVVGHPLHMTGEVGQMALEAARFGARLGRALDLPVELFDERLTSWEARESLARATGRARRRPQKAVDDLAATVLLRDYLEHQRLAAVPRGTD